MRELHRFSEEQPAGKFTAVLNARSLPATLEVEDSQYVVWIRDDDHRDAARVVLQDFLANPNADEFTTAKAEARRKADDELRATKARRRRHVNIQERWAGVWYRCYPATMVLMAISLFVSAACTDFGSDNNAGLLRFGLCNDDDSSLLPALFIQKPISFGLMGLVKIEGFSKPDLPATLRSGEVWRVVTPIFLHFSVLHILFNMMWLNTLGRAIEFVRGTRRFLAFVLSTAVLSNVAQLYWSGPQFGGMSGVVYGLIGYLWMRGRTQPEQGLGLSQNQVVYSVLWLLLCLGGAMGPIANVAHVVGFAFGILIGARKAVMRKIKAVLSGSSRGAQP